MLKIRLMRMGRKKKPHYRIVVTDSRNPNDGKYVEKLGWYSPTQFPDDESKQFYIDLELYQKWIEKGAQVNEKVKSLIRKYRKYLESKNS